MRLDAQPNGCKGYSSYHESGIIKPLCIDQTHKAPVQLDRGFVERILGNDLLSHTLPCSIIGDGGLNYRVRNGTGCTPSSLVTKKKAEYITRIYQ